MPPGWEATRRRVLARDGWRCRLAFVGVCSGHATEVHHTRPGVELDELLVSACSACHLRVTLAQATAARQAS